jgi:hypothetical protein
MTANAPGPPRPAGSKPLTQEQQQAQQTRQSNYDSASDSMSAARTAFNNAVSDYSSAVSHAVSTINNAINGDGLKDSWWDRNFGWISKVFTVIAIAVMVLAIVALIIVCPFSAGLLAAIGISSAMAGTISSVIGTTLVVLTVCQAIFDGFAAATGKESWVAFGMDIFALVTFGYGKAVEASVKGITETAEITSKVLAGSQAGRDVYEADRLPGYLYDLSKNPKMAYAVSVVAGDTFDTANEAAKSATEVLETALKGAKGSSLSTLLTMSPDISEEVSKLTTLADKAPDLTLNALSASLAKDMAVVNGVVQWSSFAGGGAFTLHGILAGG